MSDAKLLFAGLPHTGKSSFLALLNLAITSSAKVSLSLGHFKDDREYLNGLTNKLLSCEPADRTLVGQSDGLTLSLLTAAGHEIALSIPDLSGETWRDVLTDRVCADDLIERIESTPGICIFVHALDFSNDPTIADVHRAAAALGEEPEHFTADSHQQWGDGTAWSSQVALVDLMQLLSRQFAPEPKRVALVVSAFDVAAGQSPADWIAENAPLADQFLRSNAETVSVRVFGLSAQGGRFDDAQELSELRQRHPLERAYVLDSEGSPVDLDAPIVWALAVD